MMSQFGKCNVCATPCASCMRLAQEILSMGSTSNCSLDKSLEHEVSCEQGSEPSAASYRKSEGGILDSNNDQSSFEEGAGPGLSIEYQRIDMGKMNETGHLRSCSMDHIESFSSIIMARAANDHEHKQDVVAGEKTFEFEFAEDSASESVNCSNHKERIVSVKQSNVKKHFQPPEFVSCDGESVLLNYVKVCDICGDTGHKEFLAVCSKCHVAAEHVYCMHTMLETVPDGNWMCEECILSEDKDKMTETKFENFVACAKYKSSNQSVQGGKISYSSDFKVLPEIDTTGLDAGKSREDEASSPLSARRALGNVTCPSMTKRLALGTESGASFISQDSSKDNAPDFERKPSNKLSLPNNLPSRTRSIQEKSGQHLPKSHKLQMATGNLSKSKSFNDLEKRPKVQWLDEIPENYKNSIETHNKKKGSTVRTMRKALSSIDASSGSSNAFIPKSKRIPTKFSEDGGLKRLRCMKEHTSVEMTYNSRFKRLQAGSRKEDTFVSASSLDKGFGSHGEITSPDVKKHDLRTVQISNDSGTASSGKTVCSPVADVVQDVPFPIVSDVSQEIKHKGETSRHSLESRIPCSCSDAIGEEKLTVLQISSNETEKTPQAFDLIPATECMSNGSGVEYCGRTGCLCHASYCHLADSSSVSVLDTTMLKDMDGSMQIYIGPSFCNQINANKMLAVPVIDCIWKGECEIQNSFRLPRVLYRIQAHLSTRSSSKIPEAVKKFSNKILLEEVSRLTAWPIQFQEYYPRDDSIGLYIFAEDIESYGNYKSLLQYMADFDIALLGNFNRIELLIFSSHLLPESSRYWNGLLFLWGVFKERKVNGS